MTGLGLGLPLLLALAGLIIAFRKWRKYVGDLDQEAQIVVGPKDQPHGSRNLCYVTIGMVLILFKFYCVVTLLESSVWPIDRGQGEGNGGPR